MGANLVFTMASIPLALHYLPKEEFAIWALVTQVGGYLSLIDLGMQVSVSRILADHKDDRDGRAYGSILLTGQIVYLVQGLLITLLGILCAPWLAAILSVGELHEAKFTFLLQAHAVFLGLGLTLRISSAPFWCHQRYDIINHAGSVGLLVSFLGLWAGFHAGWGINSMLVGNAVAVLGIPFLLGWAAWRLGFFPVRGHWGSARLTVFWELFNFGRDVFLLALGSQLLSASQIIIISRTLGLEAAAIWAICSKLFVLAQQMVGKLYEFCAGGFTEMIVRGERDRLWKRFRDIVIVTASLSILIGVIGAVSNAGFVRWWTGGRVSWAGINDILMAIYVCCYTFTRCHTGIAGVTKNLRGLRYVYLFEGLTFFALAWWCAPRFSFPGIIVASIVATVAWAGTYGLHHSRQHFHVKNRELLSWLHPAFRLLLLLAPLAAVLAAMTRGLPEPARFALIAGTLAAIGFPLFIAVGLPPHLRHELIGRSLDLLRARRGPRPE